MANEQRSRPGYGERVALYLLDDASDDSCFGRIGDTAICTSVGEDFSTARWPVVVKVKAGVDRASLATHLQALMNALEGEQLH